MTDKAISDLSDGGTIQDTDELAVNRSGTNYKVQVGSMAAEDAADYDNSTEVDTKVQRYPDMIDVSGDLTLTSDHNGTELNLRDSGESPAAYTITVPESLSVNFRCTFFKLTDEVVTIATEAGSPVDSLNGISNGSATIGNKYSAAYLRKRGTGELTITGGGVVVS